MNESEYLEMCRTEWPKVVDENANLRMKIEAMEWHERNLGDEMVKQTLRADELKEHLAIWIERAEKAESEAAAMRKALWTAALLEAWKKPTDYPGIVFVSHGHPEDIYIINGLKERIQKLEARIEELEGLVVKPLNAREMANDGLAVPEFLLRR